MDTPLNVTADWGDDMCRLLCVAFSRPRVTLVVLGKRAAVMSNPLLARLCSDAVEWKLPL